MEILKSPFIYLKILYPYTAITGFLRRLQDSITCLVLSYCTLWDYVLSFITLLSSCGSRYLDIDTLCSFFTLSLYDAVILVGVRKGKA